jgi:hypothetical protein
LGVHFALGADELRIPRPDGCPFQPVQEVFRERDVLAAERDVLAAERNAERQRVERLAALLCSAGIDPDASG